MIKALLDKIGTLFEAEFLFGSFLPALVFAAALMVTGAWVLGLEKTLAWAQERPAFDRALLPLVLGVVVVVFAYVLSGIRPLLVQLWSGEADFVLLRPFANILRALQRRRFLEQRAAAGAAKQWGGLTQWLRDAALAGWQPKPAPAPPNSTLTNASAANLSDISEHLADLNVTMTLDDVKHLVQREFLDRLKQFNGNSLSAIYDQLRQTFSDWDDEERGRLSTLRWKLGRDFGPTNCIRSTRLGNIIEAYNQYSFTRYRIEPETFWPHLQTQIPDALARLLSNASTTMDFALTAATLAVVYVVLCALAGPWLYASFAWLLPCVSGVVVAMIAYGVAVAAAEQFGALFRAAFDLYRLPLLTALHRSAPTSLTLERTKWEELSRLVTYGETTDFELAPPATPAVMP